MYRIEYDAQGTINTFLSLVLNNKYCLIEVVHRKVNFSQPSFHLSVLSGIRFPVSVEFNNVSPFILLWRKCTLICTVNKASPLVKYTVYINPGRAASKSVMCFKFSVGRHQNIPKLITWSSVFSGVFNRLFVCFFGFFFNHFCMVLSKHTAQCFWWQERQLSLTSEFGLIYFGQWNGRRWRVNDFNFFFVDNLHNDLCSEKWISTIILLNIPWTLVRKENASFAISLDYQHTYIVSEFR